MRIVRLAAGTRWAVYAAFSRNDEDCPLLDFVSELDQRVGDRVLSDLQQYVPETEPSHWARTEFSSALSGGVFEFRWPTGRGGTPRVLWFYDANRVIVCSHGMNKKGSMRAAEIETAEDVRHRYRSEKAAGRIEIIDFRDLEGRQ